MVISICPEALTYLRRDTPRTSMIFSSIRWTVISSRTGSEKLGPRVREKFFPPQPDKLFEALFASTPVERDAVERIARSFMQTLLRMTVDERRLILDPPCEFG